ncbi:hypothetical protein [Calothrix sp. UHCC 0171]|uniref:hypothetical protein n=1 Tax=Calothrix sp. UHCC 0171 TaxID=3110245 RepID=UPI002B1F92AC|nr:hypothetical protein [Calothrix sp. UHCC 0171]MEA5573898.1 hypothetical protein [Calothrix sp. UHCC 0171]
MLYRLGLTFGLVLTCLAATTTVTLAESATVEIQFSGTIPERTSVSIPTNQVAESLSSSSLKTLEASQPSNNITNLRFNSTRSTDVIVSPPQFVSGSHPEPQGTTHSSLLKVGTDTNNLGRTSATMPPGETDLQLQTLIKAPQDFPPGTYNYTTTLTTIIP